MLVQVQCLSLDLQCLLYALKVVTFYKNVLVPAFLSIADIVRYFAIGGKITFHCFHMYYLTFCISLYCLLITFQRRRLSEVLLLKPSMPYELFTITEKCSNVVILLPQIQSVQTTNAVKLRNKTENYKDYH
jgi:hypothetical protein